MWKLIIFLFVVTNSSQAKQTERKYKKWETDLNDIPRIVVNLDLSPCNRWNEMAKRVNPKKIEEGIEALLLKVLPSKEMLEVAEAIAQKINRYFQEPFADEMRCLSEASGVSLGKVVLANVFYELSATSNSTLNACTSIVTLDNQGKIIHGRNMDFAEPEFLKAITVIVDFQRNSKTIYTGVTFMGYVGLFTGVRHGAFTLTQNARYQGSFFQNLLAMLDGAELVGFVARRVLDEHSDYLSAYSRLVDTPTVAPVYFIIGGVEKTNGAIVVRNGWKAIDVKVMKNYPDHSWFLVETNYDPGEKPPITDNRRGVAVDKMLKIGLENMDVMNLFEVLSTPPVLNNETVYTTIMSASDPHLLMTKIRYDAPKN